MGNFAVIRSGEGFRASAAIFTVFTRFLMPTDSNERAALETEISHATLRLQAAARFAVNNRGPIRA